MWLDELLKWQRCLLPAKVVEAARTNKQFLWRTNCSKSKEYRDEVVYVTDLPNKQDYSPFEEHFDTMKSMPSSSVVSFHNLSRTSTLVVPKPLPYKNYATIRDFTRTAPLQQQQALWKLVALEAQRLMRQGAYCT
jgi:hypothetical protein